MDFNTIVSCVLVAVTAAFVLGTLASMFAGRTDGMIRSAGLSIVMLGVTAFVTEHVLGISFGEMKGIGWIVEPSGRTLLMMYIIGGALFVIGTLGGMMRSTRTAMAYKSSQRVIGEKRLSPSRMAMRRQVRAFGRRIAPKRTSEPANGLKRNND